MADAIRIDRRDDRVMATLTRPEVRNAIDQGMIDELHALCAELETAPRILVLTGADGLFASGADIAQLRDRNAAERRRPRGLIVDHLHFGGRGARARPRRSGGRRGGERGVRAGLWVGV